MSQLKFVAFKRISTLGCVTLVLSACQVPLPVKKPPSPLQKVEIPAPSPKPDEVKYSASEEFYMSACVGRYEIALKHPQKASEILGDAARELSRNVHFPATLEKALLVRFQSSRTPYALCIPILRSESESFAYLDQYLPLLRRDNISPNDIQLVHYVPALREQDVRQALIHTGRELSQWRAQIDSKDAAKTYQQMDPIFYGMENPQSVIRDAEAMLIVTRYLIQSGYFDFAYITLENADRLAAEQITSDNQNQEPFAHMAREIEDLKLALKDKKPLPQKNVQQEWNVMNNRG